MQRRPGPATGAAVLAAVAVLLVTVLAVLGARSAPWVPAGPASAATATATPGPPPATRSAPRALDTAAAPSAPLHTSDAFSTVTYVVVGVVLVTAVAGLALLVGGLAHRRTRRPRRLHGPAAAPEDDGADAALPAAVARALAVVEDPDAREAVVRSWLLLGRAAERAGTPPRPAETAAEYARRLAAERGLPAADVEQLAALYREARFSTHEVTAEQRDRARAHLLALREALAARPAGGRR